jgi:phytoene dehydrogenase-like protein
MLDASQLPDEFVEAIARYKCGSGSFRINVALSELPDFVAAPGSSAQTHHASGIVFAPSLAYMDQAWRDAVADGCSTAPVVEMLIPSVVDDTLAPAGAHVASLFCQQFDPGADWSRLKPTAVERIFDVVQAHCPNFRSSLLGCRALSPQDLEDEFGLVGGDIFHDAVARPAVLDAVMQYARYRGPLWACITAAQQTSRRRTARQAHCARDGSH